MIDQTMVLRTRWARRETTTNGWLVVPNPFTAEIASRAGFDSLCIDMQHGLIDEGTVTDLLTATTAARVPTLVRVPGHRPETMMRVLDAGAAGVIVPLVESPDEALQAARACRYPPAGRRSFGPVRAGLVDGADYHERADAAVLVFVMIETKRALDDLDAILDTPGIDGAYVGPADLSLALGYPPETDSVRAPHQDAVRRVVEACHARGLVAGLHTAQPAFAAGAAAWGMDFVTIATDASAMRQELARRVAAFRDLVPRP